MIYTPGSEWVTVLFRTNCAIIGATAWEESVRDQLWMLEEFHRVFGAHHEQAPTASLSAETIALRVSLIQEELNEYRHAAEARDLVGVADALSDLMYVVLGTYVAHGLQDLAEALFAEVHASNMSKLDEDGRVIYRSDGKVLKSALWRPPNLAAILD